MKTPTVSLKLISLLVALALSLPLAACGTLEVGIEKTSTPSVTTDVSHNTAWAEYTDRTYGVSLQYPAHWQPVEGYERRYGGPDGFFQLSAISGIGRTLNEVCQSEAYHKLQPYGSQPEVGNIWIQGLAVCRIFPSGDQPPDMNRQAALIFLYPQPIGIGGETYHFFILWADRDHIQGIGETLRFIALAPLPEPTTLFSDTVLGIAFDIPSGWHIDGRPGAEAQFTVRDEAGAVQGMLTLSVLSEESTTLALALDEVQRGAWGPSIRNVRPTTLGEFRALRVEMTPEGDRPSVIWLVVAPSGRAVGFIPRGDSALVEAALVTLRAISPAPTLAASSDMPPGLVFGTNTGLWQVGEDGRARQILNRSDVLLSPDGTQALYTSPDADLWLIDLTTGAERNLTNTPDRMECCPQWWPARPDTIVFGSWPKDADLGPSTGFLTTVRVDGSDYRVLSERQSNAPPAPAPDGQTIACDQGGTAYLYRRGADPVLFDPAAYGLPVQRIGSPAWSPDGKRLTWVVGGDFGQGWRIGLGVFDLEARTARLMHPFEPRGVGGWGGAAVWSPDGEWLAYAIWPAADPNEEGICVFRAEGEEEHCLGPGGGPVWSPDGRRLAFRRDSALWLAEAGTWNLLWVVDDAWSVAWPK